VYLFHLPIARLLLLIVCRHTAWPQAALASTTITRYLAATAAVMAVTWLLAAIHYTFIEQRVLRMRPPVVQSPAAVERVPSAHHSQAAGWSRFPAQAL
jgi:peptidoglycan/LPS O-acetylase OafA/YrhL